jgi:hypothetical protein
LKGKKHKWRISREALGGLYDDGLRTLSALSAFSDRFATPPPFFFLMKPVALTPLFLQIISFFHLKAKQTKARRGNISLFSVLTSQPRTTAAFIRKLNPCCERRADAHRVTSPFQFVLQHCFTSVHG